MNSFERVGARRGKSRKVFPEGEGREEAETEGRELGVRVAVGVGG